MNEGDRERYVYIHTQNMRERERERTGSDLAQGSGQSNWYVFCTGGKSHPRHQAQEGRLC
jgi:hypothetical protein